MPTILLLLILILFPLSAVRAAAPTSPNTIKFQSFTPAPTRTPTPTNIPTPTSTLMPIPSPTSPAVNSSKVFFSQRDPRWRTYNPNDYPDNLGVCGCGNTVAAMILARFFDNSGNPAAGNYNPPRMWDYYEIRYPDQCGTAVEWHQKSMQQFGLTARIHSYGGNPNVLKNYIDNGYTVFIHYKRPNNSGHYVLLDSVNGSVIRVYDPYDLPGSVQPRIIESVAIIVDFLVISS